MRLDTSQHMRQEMRMKLAPRMIQSMEILQLPIMALQERINQELEENPALVERESDGDEPGAAEEKEAADTNTVEERALVVDEQHNNEEDFQRLESLDEDEAWSDHLHATHRVSRAGLDEQGDRKHDAMQNMASRPQSLQDYVAQQFSFLDCPAQIRELGLFLIYNLDDKGFRR
jgi:RNA polymerase sigma-54 factor